MTPDTALALAPTPDIRVISEPRVYEERSPHSFFHDLGRANLSHLRDERARARLERYASELRADTGLEYRTNMVSNVAGSGLELTVPAWVINQTTYQARAGRVLADLVTPMFLPRGISSLHIPKETTGADAPVQQAQNEAVQEVDFVTSDAGNNNDVITLAGDSDVSIQLFEQTPAPGLDVIVYTDLSRAYNANLEQQMLAGSGSNGQMTGVINVSGRNSDTDGSGVNSVPNLWSGLGKLAAAIGNTRKLPIEFYLMAPRRWAWLASSVDSSQRPIAAPGQPAHLSDYPYAPAGAKAPAQALGSGQPYWGPGAAIYLDGAITAGTSSDYAVALRATDMLLYESDPGFTVNPNPLSGTLQVRLQLHRYAAFINTKPSSIAVLTNMPQPSGF